jgi:hypothetical protein
MYLNESDYSDSLVPIETEAIDPSATAFTPSDTREEIIGYEIERARRLYVPFGEILQLLHTIKDKFELVIKDLEPIDVAAHADHEQPAYEGLVDDLNMILRGATEVQEMNNRLKRLLRYCVEGAIWAEGEAGDNNVLLLELMDSYLGQLGLPPALEEEEEEEVSETIVDEMEGVN